MAARKLLGKVLGLIVFLLLVGVAIAKEPTPGAIIGPDNWKEFESYLSTPLIEQLKLGLKFDVGDPTIAEQMVNPPSTYWKATERYHGMCKIGPKGELQNWKAGLPFPNIDAKDPQAGLKVSYNLERQYQGDDMTNEYWRITMIDSNKRTRVIEGIGRAWMLLFMKGRVDVNPKPEILPNPDNIRYLNFLTFDTPYDLKGVARYLIRYEDPLKDDDVWMYIPTMRRVRRMSGAQRQDLMAGTEGTYDDTFLFYGRPQEYNWRILGEQKVLSLCTVKKMWLKRMEHIPWLVQNTRFLRDCWVLEAIPKSPSYVYAKRILWVDKKTAWAYATSIYDHSGRLWKIGEAGSIPTKIGPRMDGEIGQTHGYYTIIDLLGRRGTLYEYQVEDEKGRQHGTLGCGLTPDMFGVDMLTIRGKR